MIDVFATRFSKGEDASDPSTAMEASDAFTRAHSTDAHFAAYRSTGVRLVNGSIDSGRFVAEMLYFVGDVDGHGLADFDAWKEENEPKARALPGAPFVYRTRGGLRFIYQLASPFVVAREADRMAWRRFYHHTLVALFSVSGVNGDPACADAVRLFRLPHTIRDRELQRLGYVAGEPTEIGTLPHIALTETQRTLAEVALVEAGPSDSDENPWHKVLVPPPLPKARSYAPVIATGVDVYAIAAFRKAIENVGSAGKSAKHMSLAKESFALGGFVGAGRLNADDVEAALLGALGDAADRDAARTCRMQIEEGAKSPRWAA